MDLPSQATSVIREELQDLVNRVLESDVCPALEVIRERLDDPVTIERHLPFSASFEDEPTLAEQHEEILRTELGRCVDLDTSPSMTSPAG